MRDTLIVVEGLVAADEYHSDLREDVLSYALDQRAFGPRRLVVAFADRSGRLLSLAHTTRTDPPERALGPCIEHAGLGAAAAVAFCDEALVMGPQPDDIGPRFLWARSIAASYGVHLVDWWACDDQHFRSSRIVLGLNKGGHEDKDWWDVP